jgi:hypothetical protein
MPTRESSPLNRHPHPLPHTPSFPDSRIRPFYRCWHIPPPYSWSFSLYFLFFFYYPVSVADYAQSSQPDHCSLSLTTSTISLFRITHIINNPPQTQPFIASPTSKPLAAKTPSKLNHQPVTHNLAESTPSPSWLTSNRTKDIVSIL